MSATNIGFEMGKIRLALEKILPLRPIKETQKSTPQYRTILESVREAGLVEPLVVYPQKGEAGMYLLLDGHARYAVLRELGEKEADCIIATDDEGFTYNARVNRIPPIQAHKMIAKAVKSGVNPERIAAALNMTVAKVHSLVNLLDGIHPEAVELLKDKGIAPKALWFLKKVTGVRQIEIAEIMVSANNYTAGYAESLVFGTPKDQLVHPEEPKKKAGLSAEEIARMEQEMQALERNYKAIEESYGENMLNLTLARGYIKKLLENAKVVKFLSANYAEILSEFQAIAEMEAV